MTQPAWRPVLRYRAIADTDIAAEVVKEAPEDLSVLDQVRLGRFAPIIAGQGGSALHLSVSSKRGARVLKLGGPDQRPNDRRPQ